MPDQAPQPRDRDRGAAHDHRRIVEGCFRCELNQDEPGGSGAGSTVKLTKDQRLYNRAYDSGYAAGSAALEAAQGEIELFRSGQPTAFSAVCAICDRTSIGHRLQSHRFVTREQLDLQSDLAQARDRIQVLERQVEGRVTIAEEIERRRTALRPYLAVVEAAKAIDPKDRSFEMDDALNTLDAAQAAQQTEKRQ